MSSGRRIRDAEMRNDKDCLPAVLTAGTFRSTMVTALVVTMMSTPSQWSGANVRILHCR